MALARHDVDSILDCSFVVELMIQHLIRQGPLQMLNQMRYHSKLLAYQLTLTLLASVEALDNVDDDDGDVVVVVVVDDYYYLGSL